METSAVLAMSTAISEMPVGRTQKAASSAFADLLAKHCKARTLAESSGATDTPETTTETESSVSTHTPEAANPVQNKTSESVAEKTPETGETKDEERDKQESSTGKASVETPAVASSAVPISVAVLIDAQALAAAMGTEPVGEDTGISVVEMAATAPVDELLASISMADMAPAVTAGTDAGDAAAATTENVLDVSLFLAQLSDTAEDASSAATPELELESVSERFSRVSVERIDDSISGMEILEPAGTTLASGEKSKAEGNDATGSKQVASSLTAASPGIVASDLAKVAATPSATEPVSAAMLQDVVVKGVRYLISENEKTVAVRLVPPSLGELHIEVTTVADTVQVRLLSSSPTVRDALESHLQVLRDSFSRNNLEVSNISVLSGMTGQSSGQPFANPQFVDSSGTTMPRAMNAALRSATSAEPDAAVSGLPSHDGALNVLA